MGGRARARPEVSSPRWRATTLERMAPRASRRPRPQPARGLAARRLGSLRPARQFHEHAQGLDHGTLPYRAAADRAEAVFAMHDAAVARGDGEMHQADR